MEDYIQQDYSSPEYDAWVMPTAGEQDYTQGIDPSVYNDFGGGSVPGTGYVPPSMGAPMGAPGAQGVMAQRGSQQPPQANPMLAALFGAAPGMAGMLGQLMGGGNKTSPNISTAQKALGAQGTQALGYMQPGANQLWNTGTGLMNQLGQGQNPLQQQQGSILSALAPQAANLASGNVQIPPQLRALIQQAYEPYVGDITRQAIESARNRGFAGGADLLNGPAGTIAGPALANLPGLEANSLLQAMLQFPQASAQMAGAYNQPINQLTGIATGSMSPQQGQVSGYQNAFNAYPVGQTQQNTNYGAGAGQAIAGAGAGYGMASGQNQQAQQQQTNFNSLLNTLQGNQQSAGGMSGIYNG